MEVVSVELKDKPSIIVEALNISYYSKPKTIIRMGAPIEIQALKNISFRINKGECVAVLGKNGAGKSTLLEAIGGHIRPKSGTVITNGKVYTLKGANPGLIPHLSAKDNIIMMANVYAVPKDERESFLDSVEKFCELGNAFSDRDYSALSTGMAGRVGFGFTTSLNPQVLLMDETLGVGDEEFRKKAEVKAMDFMKKGETIMISTHSLNLAKKMCTRAIVLHEGNLVFDGSSSDAVQYYLEEIIKT